MVSGVVNTAISVFMLVRNGTYSKFSNPFFDSREVIRICCSLASGLIWSSHVYLYSLSAVLVGPVVAFPIVMISTMLCGQIWGVCLGEWILGEAGWKINKISIIVLVAAIVIFAVSGVIDK